MKYLILLFLFAGCVDIPDEYANQYPKKDTPTVASADVTPAKPVEKPVVLTLQQKLSIEAKEFEPLQTSYLPFCSKTPKNLNLFYTTLFYEMIRHESNFRNEEAYYECAKAKCYYSAGCFEDPIRGFCRVTGSKLDGGFAVSRGLFQLSVSSARGLGCQNFIKDSQDLHNEDKNITCAMIIAKNYFMQDKMVTGNIDGKWKGLSRYWAVMRPTFDGKPRNSYLSIQKAVQKLENCN